MGTSLKLRQYYPQLQKPDSVLRFGRSIQPKLMVQSMTEKHTSAYTSCDGLNWVGGRRGGGTTCQLWCWPVK